MKSRTAVLICTDIYEHAEKKTESLSFAEKFVKDVKDSKFLGFGEVEERIMKLILGNPSFGSSGKSMMGPILLAEALRKKGVGSSKKRQAAKREKFEFLYSGPDQILKEVMKQEQGRKSADELRKTKHDQARRFQLRRPVPRRKLERSSPLPSGREREEPLGRVGHF